MMNRWRIVFWGIAIVIALCVSGFFGMRSILRKQKLKPFNEHMAEYTKVVDVPEPAGALPKAPVPDVPEATKVKGKLITIDMNVREIDYIYFSLPESIVAKTPEEVGTIVQIVWGKELKPDWVYGKTNPKPAYYQVCAVTVIDKETKQKICGGNFRGSEPPQSIKDSEKEGVGTKPEQEVADYLSRLIH